MWLILLCSLASLALIVDRLKYFLSIEADEAVLKMKVFDLVKQNKIKDAVIVCEQSGAPMARIIKAALVYFGSPRSVIKDAIESAGRLEVSLMERNLTALSTIAHLAPVLGLLGTVLGLANSFFIIQSRALALNPVTPGDIAGGIWEALLTTIFGLIVSIPATLVYNYCVSRVDEFIFQVEQASADILGMIAHFADNQHE